MIKFHFDAEKNSIFYELEKALRYGLYRFAIRAH